MSSITPNFGRGEFRKDGGYNEYIEGFKESSDKHLALIDRLLNALDNRHAGDYVDKIREEYGLELS